MSWCRGSEARTLATGGAFTIMPAVRSRWMRMLVWPILAAVPLWLAVMPLAASRVLSFELAGPIEIDGNACAIRWQSSSGRENGA